MTHAFLKLPNATGIDMIGDGIDNIGLGNFLMMVAYRGARERDIGTPSPEEAVTLGG